MNLHRFSLAAATLLALSHLPAGETRSRLDKNPIDNNPPIPPTPIFVEPPPSTVSAFSPRAALVWTPSL